MIVVAITIGIIYIQPTIADIRTIEDTTTLYKNEITKVSAVNQNLSAQLATLEAISPGDNQALEKYLPNSVDEVAVMKDITTIFSTVGVAIAGIDYVLPDTKNSNVDSDTVDPYQGLDQSNFTVTATLDNQQLLRILNAIEINDYLLQVSSLKITPSETASVLQIELVLTAFSRSVAVPLEE